MLETLADLFVAHGVPAHIRSDNGPEFTAALVRHWLAALNVETLFIERYCQMLCMSPDQAAFFLMPSTKGTPSITSVIN